MLREEYEDGTIKVATRMEIRLIITDRCQMEDRWHRRTLMAIKSPKRIGGLVRKRFAN